MPTAYYTTEGLVLRKMPFGEADFLVRIITRDFGKMDILARGARKSASKLNPHLDMLNFLRIAFVQNGERLPTLTDAEIIERFDDWFLDADSIALAGRMLKTIDAIVHAGERDPGLLDIVRALLQSIKDNADGENIGNRFVQAFLAHQGYGEKTDYSLLPPEVADTIMKTWPNSMT